jgi:hypothetical protein
LPQAKPIGSRREIHLRETSHRDKTQKFSRRPAGLACYASGVWLLFTGKSRTRAVADGEVLREHCPVCERTTRFVEIEVEHSAGVWFLDVVSDKERKFRCLECGENFDRVEEQPAAKPASSKPVDGMDRVEQLAAEQRKRDAAKAQIASKIDDEVAELKRRMGR